MVSASGDRADNPIFLVQVQKIPSTDSFNAPEPEIVLVMESLASGDMDENTLQVWLAKYADQLHE